MLASLKSGGAALLWIGVGVMMGSASAVSVDVAKKCEVLTFKAFPPREPGNPAAGSAKGTAAAVRRYFNECIANGGTMDDDARANRSK